MKENTLFHITCPCKCGRVLAVEFHATKKNEKFIPHIKKLDEQGIENLGNIIWQRVVNARGLEGAIQFLHQRSEG